MDRQEIFKKVGAKIRAERIRQNISITELADKLDIEYNNLIRIEKGRTNPTLGTLFKICESLNIRLIQIMDVEGESNDVIS